MRTPPGGAAAEAIRQYWPMVYAPTALYSMGQGALIPVLPSIATAQGANLGLAALVAGAILIGQLCGNLPAGWLVARAGERRAMIIASVISVISVAGMLLAPNLATLTACVFIVGMCASAFALARHAFMTVRVPLAYRARALALVGGSFRLGTFTGPVIAAGLIWVFGDAKSTIWFFGAALIAVGLLVTFGPDPEERALAAEQRQAPNLCAATSDTGTGDTGEAITGPIRTPRARPRTGLFRTIWNHRGVLIRLGFAASSLASVRAGRQAIIPLWGVSIGLDAATISLLVGIAGAIEFSLFYASGQVMDRFGRLWATVPSQLVMALSFLALAFTHDSDDASMWFGVFAIAVGVGNGLSSGALLTLGSDVAPADNTAAFLGAWRTFTDAGAASTPLVVAGLTTMFSLSIATGAVGVVALAGAGAFMRWVPRYSPTR
ncbi:MFS transporter [Microbacterium amylolyticum]|uniref:MFS family permease n=1 Tax=Microbacterium amylolyticum TaxID=936337 RepID=A0ABS4ZKJ3_9MICO|nr:MFS transporter [Microbacterium amylolyticum]MBP2437815.1 MFS family permease [Microbacterium amylolyticum]